VERGGEPEKKKRSHDKRGLNRGCAAMRNRKKEKKGRSPSIHQSIGEVVCPLSGVLESLRFSNQSINQSGTAPSGCNFSALYEYFILSDSLFIREYIADT